MVSSLRVKQFGQAAIKLARTTDHSGCRVKHTLNHVCDGLWWPWQSPWQSPWAVWLESKSPAAWQMYGSNCTILRLLVLNQCQRVTDGWTDTMPIAKSCSSTVECDKNRLKHGECLAVILLHLRSCHNTLPYTRRLYKNWDDIEASGTRRQRTVCMYSIVYLRSHTRS